MLISDDLYGEFVLEHILIDLINSEEVQRLKDIHMIGPSYLLNPLWNETRFEHSVGVMLLVRKLGGSLEEQIAGLLHDVSHTVFSHVVDMVMKKPNEDYHEEIKVPFIANSSIPKILKNYGFHYESILLDDTQWGILEQSSPLLCADRIDYTLREIHRYYNVDIQEIHTFISKMKVVDNKIVLNSIQAGEWFIKQYYKVVIDLFYDPINIYGYEIMSKILDYCLTRQLLSANDFMKSETEILDYLHSIKDSRLKVLFQTFYKPVIFQEVNSDGQYHIHQKKKTRLVDPLIDLHGQIVPVTFHSSIAQEFNKQAIQRSNQGIYLSIK